MARNTRTRKAAARRAAPASALRNLRASAIKAFEADINAAAGVRRSAEARAEEARARTVEAVTHLEKVFEARVSRAISRLGVPTSQDVRALSRRVAELQSSVDQLKRARARAAAR